MSVPAASAKITLSYPLYASDFDPQNSGFLLVGGGGGEGRSGVGNKIVSVPRVVSHENSLIYYSDPPEYIEEERALRSSRYRPFEKRGLSHFTCICTEQRIMGDSFRRHQFVHR